MPRNVCVRRVVLQVLLPARHPGQGGRSASCLPVRRRSQDGRHCGGGMQWILTQNFVDPSAKRRELECKIFLPADK